jgi:lipopolysaccharide export system permease protein
VQSSRYIIILKTSDINLSRFLQFASYLSIDIITVILPISLAISAAFVYQKFVESCQLIALESSGVSPRRMLYPLLMLVGIVTCYLYLSNAYISPLAWREFRSLEFKIANNIDPPKNAGLIFSNSGFSIYAKEYVGDLYFGDIYIVDVRNSEKTYSYFAQKGTIRNNVLLLTNGERAEIDFGTHENSILHFKSYSCDLKEIIRTQTKQVQPTEKFMSELLVKDNNMSATLTQFALFHQKLLSPLLTIIFSIIAFLLILQAPYRRKLSYKRIWILVAIITMIQGTFLGIANAGAKNPDLIAVNYVLIICCLLIVISLIVRKCKL